MNIFRGKKHSLFLIQTCSDPKIVRFIFKTLGSRLDEWLAAPSRHKNEKVKPWDRRRLAPSQVKYAGNAGLCWQKHTKKHLSGLRPCTCNKTPLQSEHIVFLIQTTWVHPREGKHHVLCQCRQKGNSLEIKHYVVCAGKTKQHHLACTSGSGCSNAG